MFNIFGKNNTPEAQKQNAKEQVRTWTRKMKGEVRTIEREIQKIEREENKVKNDIKSAAKGGNLKGAQILAKELVRSGKAKERMYLTRTQLSSVQMELQSQVATMKVADSMKSSTEVMKHMSKLMNVPELRGTMKDLQKEMMKAGLIEEMIEDSMDMMDPIDAEDATQDEVDKILAELAVEAGSKVPESVAVQQQAVAQPEEKNTEAENDLFDRLQAL